MMEAADAVFMLSEAWAVVVLHASFLSIIHSYIPICRIESYVVVTMHACGYLALEELHGAGI
jgi:hypothetical protein